MIEPRWALRKFRDWIAHFVHFPIMEMKVDFDQQACVGGISDSGSFQRRHIRAKPAVRRSNP